MSWTDSSCSVVVTTDELRPEDLEDEPIQTQPKPAGYGGDGQDPISIEVTDQEILTTS